MVAPAAVEATEAIPVQFVTAARETRLTALRRVLDQLDPNSAVVFTRDEASESDVRDVLHALGYGGGDAASSPLLDELPSEGSSELGRVRWIQPDTATPKFGESVVVFGEEASR